MMMVESMTQTFNSMNTNSKKTYKKEKNVEQDGSSSYSSKNSIISSATNSNEWHRLLLARLKPGVTRKYRTTRKNTNKLDSYISASFEDSNVTLKSYTDDSFIIDNSHIIISESDISKQFDSSIDSSIRKDNHYVKNSVSNRPVEHMTSLKRRVRKQQMRHVHNQANILQESTFQLPSPADLYLISYPPQSVTSRRYRQKKSSCVVPLPPLMNTTRVVPNHVHGVKLNLYAY